MTTTQPTSFSWNLVTRNLHGHELLRKKIHEKITKLEKHLKHFPPDTVHLQIALERHPKKPLHTAALTLRCQRTAIPGATVGPRTRIEPSSSTFTSLASSGVPAEPGRRRASPGGSVVTWEAVSVRP